MKNDFILDITDKLKELEEYYKDPFRLFEPTYDLVIDQYQNNLEVIPNEKLKVGYNYYIYDNNPEYGCYRKAIITNKYGGVLFWRFYIDEDTLYTGPIEHCDIGSLLQVKHIYPIKCRIKKPFRVTSKSCDKVEFIY